MITVVISFFVIHVIFILYDKMKISLFLGEIING